MSSWHPNDLLTDLDLRAYEASVLQQFGQTTWADKRLKALEDWLFPILKGHGFDPQRLRTRYECDHAWGFTGAVYTDLTAATRSTTENDINLATVFTTAGTDALYIGSIAPFRGLFFRLLDSVSTVAGIISVAYWNGVWKALSVADSTVQVSGKTLSGGGSVTWTLPVDWMTRGLSTATTPLYWVKVTVNATPTGATASQIGVIRQSALRAPATYRTLMLIMREAPTGQDGPWADKAEFYREEADDSLQRALNIVGGEFETDDPPTDLISATEAEQTSAEAGGGWRFERA